MKSAPRPRVLWCGDQRHGSRGNGWSFPTNVEKLLVQLTAGKKVFHPFGGLSRFGVRGDIDPLTRPDVIADAWLPPFKRDAFDVVILDPPYHSINQQMKAYLLVAAAYIASDRVIWFHTQWIPNAYGLKRKRSWLVRVGNSCACRCIQEFKVVRKDKPVPRLHFTRGPAIKYNRWIQQGNGLPLEAVDELRPDQSKAHTGRARDRVPAGRQ